jgi:polysaccharide biosynthesis/export protein
VAERCFYPADVGGSTPSAPTRRAKLGRRAILILAVAAPALAACGDDKTTKAMPVSDEPSSEYVIGPGDVLSVSVYQSQPLSVTDLPVRPDGRISVPLVSDLMAAGKTPAQLEKDIAERLTKYVQNPVVTVMVRSFQGPPDRQVRVIGEAVDPQAIPYRDNLTVLDVMIATKGLTKFAAGNSAVIVRRDGPNTKRIKVRLSDLIKDGDISQNVAMHPGDTLIIPQSWF